MRSVHFRPDHKEATETQPTFIYPYKVLPKITVDKNTLADLKPSFLGFILLFYCSFWHSQALSNHWDFLTFLIAQHSESSYFSSGLPLLVSFVYPFRVSNLGSNLTLLKCLIQCMLSNGELNLNISTGRSHLQGIKIDNILSTYVQKWGQFFCEEIKLSID